MKITFSDYTHGNSIHLTPETPQETAQLIRFAANVKKQPADITFYFSTEPNLYINFEKVAAYQQRSSISASIRKK